MNESSVKSRTVEYFEKNGYYTLKEFELDCVNKMLKIDVIAYKWLDEYDLEAIAVECKGNNMSIHKLIETIYIQLREYQAGFPITYLAVPKNIGKVPRDLLESYGIGLLTIGDKVRENISPNSEKSAPKLDSNIYGYGVRQKLVAYMTLQEITKKNTIKCSHANNFGFGCWVDEFYNYCIYNDVFLNREYHLSIVIDQQKNVKRALRKANPQDLYELLRNLPEDFLFSVYQVFVAGRGLRSYKPVLRLPIRDINMDFLNWLIEFAKENKYKTSIHIGRKIWSIDDFLPKSKHLKRAKEVMKYLKPLKQYFEEL